MMFLNFLPGRRHRLSQELDRELHYHLNARVEDLVRSGMSEPEARRRAAMELGSIAQVTEETRETWVVRWVDDRARDIRYGVRTLAAKPGFALMAMLSIALGIGANAAIFSLFDQVMLHGLQTPEPQRLVHFIWRGQRLSTGWGGGYLVSYPLCRDLDGMKQLFDGVFCRHELNVNFRSEAFRENVRAEIVSGGYFSGLGAKAEKGRLLDRSDDERPGEHPVVVLSHKFVEKVLGGADVVGRKVLVNNYPMTVVGIAAEGFSGIDPHATPAVWVPAMMAEKAGNIDSYWNRMLDRRAVWMNAYGRLKPGVSSAGASAGIRPWFQTMLQADTQRLGFPVTTAEQRQRYFASTMELQPAQQGASSVRPALAKPLWVLMSGAFLLLLLACMNVANLTLARGLARTRELTTRVAVGATRMRITGQLLVESLLVSLGGGVLGLFAAPWVARVVMSFLARDGDAQYRADYRVLAAAFVACLVTGALCALAPALAASRISLVPALNERAPSATGGVRLRKLLVAGQLAFTLLLLTGAALFVQTVARLQERVGFDSSNLVMVRLNPPANGYAVADAERVMRDTLRKLNEIPAVETAAIGNAMLLSGGMSSSGFTVECGGRRSTTGSDVSRMRVGPGFFAALGTRVIAGRDFDERDVRPAGTAPTPYRTVIVNESFARRYFPGRSPVGCRIGTSNRPDAVVNIEILGVVKDFPRRNLRDEALEQVFLQFWDQNSGDGTFYVRVRGSVAAASTTIRATVAQVDAGLPVKVTAFDDQIEQSMRTERMVAALSSGFGVIALLLAVVGIYGVMSFVVTRRTHEIGLRMALGAARWAAVWLVARDTLLLIAAGVAVAAPLIWGLGRLVEAQLYGIGAVDVPTLAGVGCLLATVALGAAMLPAKRAASVSPTQALRMD